MRKKQSKCFSCPTAFPMFGGKLGNRTPVLSLSVKEVTLIYRIILNFGCCRYKMTFMICQLTGSVQRPKSDLNRRPPAWQAGALTRLSYWAIIIFWLLPLLDIVAVGTQSLISPRVVRVYHMLIESPTREFLWAANVNSCNGQRV